jgi:hypothetical protein
MITQEGPVAMVHIGLHKTGTTAFQEALDLASPLLARHQIRVMQYRGNLYPDTPRSQAFDLANAVIRLDIDAYFRLREPQALLSSVLLESERSVREYAGCPEPLLIASMESLSLVSCTAEVERLVELLSPREVHIIIVLRDRSEFLTSMRKQIQRLGLRRTMKFPDSCLYLEDDTWIADFDRLKGLFTDVLGLDRVHIIDYDQAVKHYGSVVPELWSVARLPTLAGREDILEQPWTNLTPIDHLEVEYPNIDDITDAAELKALAVSVIQEIKQIKSSRSWKLIQLLRKFAVLNRIIRKG